MSRRKHLILKSTALFLVFTIVSEICYPSVAYALTSGPTTPEVYAHQPVDATDNVGLVTGDFNYTIPITSIPEYPMAIGLTGQSGMDQDAGIFGYGINGFSGAIARSMSGLPDDLSGGLINYQYSNQPNWNASVTGTIGVGVSAGSVGVSANFSLLVGYDNYKGMFGAVSLGLGVAGGIGPASLNLGLGLSSETGLSGNLNVGLSSSAGSVSFGLSMTSEKGFSSSVGLSLYSFTYKASGSSFKDLSQGKFSNEYVDAIGSIVDFVESIDSRVGITDFSSATHTSTSMLAPLAATVATTKGFSLSIPPIPIPVPPPLSISISGAYSSMNYGNLDQQRKGFGFMHLGHYNPRQMKSERTDNLKHVADFTVEGEASYDNAFRNNPSYLQRDFFVVNSQGFAGSMQLYQDQNGTVSRNYSRYQMRNLNFIGLNTERKEVEPWTNVARASVNKEMDIIKLLKKSDEQDEKDFDKTIFVEEELLSLTTDAYQFNQTQNYKPQFKMRGDMAGDFNLSSASPTDYAPNQYELASVPGTGGNAQFSFLREEKDMPLYYPKALKASTDNFTRASNQIRTSSNISYRYLKEVLAAHSGAGGTNGGPADDNYAQVDPLVSGTATEKNKFNESFYSHQKIGVATNKQDSLTLRDSNLSNFNLLKSLADKRNATGGAYMDSLIADIQVKTANGLTYVYNLPVFNTSARQVSLSGKGKLAPVQDAADYSSFSEGGMKNRQKTKTTETYQYPYAWMLTAVVGPDYIDFDDIPGPSEGDLGYWVKFKYVRAASDYHWRTPYSSMMHSPLALHVGDDDVYMAASGTKEIYYISEIESAGHVSRYVYQKRFDGLDANGSDSYNGKAYNSLNQNKPFTVAELGGTDPLGNQSQYAVTRIELYKKHYEGDLSSKRLVANRRGKLLRATEFQYDYSICPQTPNNLVNYAASNAAYNVKMGAVAYHVKNTSNPTTPIESGKLTLRKVRHISYEGGSAVTLPSYELKYGFDGKTAAEQADSYNPAYDNEQVDQWGNFSKEAKVAVNNVDASAPNRTTINGIRNPADPAGPTTMNYYNGFPEVSPVRAKANAQAYKLAQILLPGGGSVAVTFDAGGYSKVQDQPPFVMRKVKTDVIRSLEAGTNHILLKLTVDITDLSQDGKGLQNLVKVNDNLYGELAFYESNNGVNQFPRREDQVFLSQDSAAVQSFGTTSTVGDRTYQEIFVKHTQKPLEQVPFVDAYKLYLYKESDKMKAIKEGVADLNTALYKYETLSKDGPMDAIKKVVGNVKKYFTKDATFETRFITAFFGDPSSSPIQPDKNLIVFSQQSYLRTPVYKSKYTGSRVSSLTYADNFQYATSGTTAAPTIATTENQYTTNYFYDAQGDGTGVSEGVATIEPGGGKSCVINLGNKRGIGFFPSPSIMLAKTTVETGYNANGTTVGNKISRKKGKTAYYFYTPKDKGYQFDNNFETGKKLPEVGKADGRFFLFGIMTWLIIKFRIFGRRITIKLPLPLPLNVRWRRFDHYHVRSYAYTDLTDMYGKPKKVVQLSSEGKEVTRNEFNYVGKQETVPVVDGTQAVPEPFDVPLALKPGRMDQVWSEAHYTKESAIDLIPWILFMNAKTERNFAFTNMKYTYVPPLLKEVTTVNAVDGTSSTQSYEMFDFYTGQALQTRNQDSYGNAKIQRVRPAYWKFPEMGPTSQVAGNLNLLTPATATYQYLNRVSASNLLGVGVVEWSQSFLKMNSSLRNTGKQYPTATEFNYGYEQMNNGMAEQAYRLNGIINRDAATKAKIHINSLPSAAGMYKPYRTYTYEVDLNTDGTFKSYTDYIYSSNSSQTQGAGWKLAGTNTLFDLYGNVVESKDLLNKYVSAHLGYNFAYSTAAVGNASWMGAAYAGAENRYTVGVTTALDDYRIALTDAKIMATCANTFVAKTLTYASLTTGNLAKVLNVCLPLTLTPANINVPFAKLNVSYANSSGQTMSRSLYVSVNENRDFKMVTDRGEAFKGFYVIPGVTQAGCGGNYKLAFDGNVFASPALDNTVTATGYTVTLANENLSACTVNAKNYTLPDNDCAGEAHTGQKAFQLAGGGKKGTLFEVVPANLPATEINRRYKALVWVHNSSPSQTALVVDNGSGTVLKSVSLATPYAKAGNWSQLRLDLTPAEYNGAAKLVFSVQNPSPAGTAIYDDFRVLPYQATMENYVYDPATGRISAKLDNENFATYFLYDNRGRLLEVKTEIENMGPTTVKKYLYNEQKSLEPLN